jgi:hypothetical protein
MLQSRNGDLTARKPQANPRPVYKIVVGAILAAGKQTSKITANSPKGTKNEKKDNETKLVENAK